MIPFRFALLVLLCLPGAIQAAGDTRNDAAREKARLEALRDQRAVLEKQLKQNESSRIEAADRLRDTETAISSVGKRLRALAAEQADARAELAARERELGQLERQIAARQAQLARLLRHQFQPREADALAVLLAGGDPNAAARDRHFLTLLSRAKADLLAALRRDTGETRRLTDVVKAHGAQLAALAQREEVERANLHQRQQERQAAMDKIAARIKVQRREIDTLKQNEQRLGNLIDSLAKRAAKPKTPVKPSAVPRHQHPSATPPAAEPGNTHAEGVFAKLRGKLARPVKGAVTGHFGARRDDGETTWKGLFFRAAEGADVHAVAAGVVVFADWLRGYGNLVIIDHGDNFLSVYGNNQSLLAEAGQKVGAGATVATVGVSGGQPESGLYFELRHHGRAFDPGKWLNAP